MTFKRRRENPGWWTRWEETLMAPRCKTQDAGTSACVLKMLGCRFANLTWAHIFSSLLVTLRAMMAIMQGCPRMSQLQVSDVTSGWQLCEVYHRRTHSVVWQRQIKETSQLPSLPSCSHAFTYFFHAVNDPWIPE